jgi:arsenate reductase
MILAASIIIRICPAEALQPCAKTTDSPQSLHAKITVNQIDKTCRIYGIKNCDTMKKAFAWLDSNAVAYEFTDIKVAGVAARYLPGWNQRVGWKLLLNTRGLTWRKLDEEQRANLGQAKALKLMAEYPSLIKRPIVDYANRLLVGFDPERYLAEFVQHRTL